MALTLTASYVQSGESAYGAKHAYMLLALDELLYARFSGKSPLAFQANPVFALGDRYSFGTPSNFPLIAGPYTAASESAGGVVVGEYPEGKVVLVDGGNSFRSLNRKTVSYSSSLWWADFTGGDPERFERLGVADIAVENYTDPVAGVNTTFTYRSHWDRHGCVRIHNGNRFSLTVNFSATGQSVTIDPYGIVACRRLHQTGSFSFDADYLFVTKPGDRMSYQRNDSGQSAANMETAYEILSTTDWLRYNGPDIDTDTTSRETSSFRGSNPVSTDYFYDWINSRGDFLSVIADLNENKVYQTVVTYGGLSTGFTTSDYVVINYYSGDTVARIQSTVSWPHPNYTHHLVPITSNLTNGQIIDVKGYGTAVLLPSIQRWNHLQTPNLYGTLVSSDNTVYAPYYGGSEYTYPSVDYTEQTIDSSMWNTYHVLNSEMFPQQFSSSWLTTNVDQFFKSNGSLGRRVHTTLKTSSFNYADLDLAILQNGRVYDNEFDLVFASSFGINSSRQRFVPFAFRKYQPAGSLVDGTASYTSHPEDNDLHGTPDKSGSQQSLYVFESTATKIKIEGNDANRTSTVGMNVYTPQSNLWYVLNKLETSPTWWITSGYANFSEEQKLITWRFPRLIEHLNDLVKAINNVAEVYPCDVRHLYKQPLPSNCFELPFTLNGDPAFAIPTDWVCGRHEGGVGGFDLTNWASYWSIPLNNINTEIQSLQNKDRYIWCYNKSNRVSSPPYGLYANSVEKTWIITYTSTVDSESPYIVKGVSFHNRYAMLPKDFYNLFGGLSSYNTYKYIRKADMVLTFISLGIPIPAVPCGERYTPTYYEDTTLTKVGGTYYGDRPETFRDWMTDGYGNRIEACIYYKKPEEASSTWRRKINDGEQFRLIEDHSVSARRYYVPQATGGSPAIEWFVHETSEDATSITDNPYSDRVLSPQTSSIDSYGIKTDTPAYPTLTELHSEWPVLLVAGPEPQFNFGWVDPIPAYDTTPNYYNVSVTNPTTTGSLFFKEVAVADMPITATKIKTWTGVDHNAWHCQIIQRTGVLRE